LARRIAEAGKNTTETYEKIIAARLKKQFGDIFESSQWNKLNQTANSE